MGSILLACSWLFVGPQLIWFYESVAIRRCVKFTRRLRLKKTDAKNINDVARKWLYSDRFNVFFTASFCAVVLWSYISNDDFILRAIGYDDHGNWIYISVSLGVMLASYYASIGFCFSFRTAMIASAIAKSEIKINMYSTDGLSEFKFLGRFIFQTSLMFNSGWLFMPSMITMSRYSTSVNSYLSLYLLTFMFIASGFTGFIYPIIILHRKLINMKEQYISKFQKDANKTLINATLHRSEEANKHFDFYEKLYLRIRSIPTWPLSVDTALRLILTSVLIPLIVALLSAQLRNGIGGNNVKQGEIHEK